MTASPKTFDAGRRPDIEAELEDHYHVQFSYTGNMSTEQFDLEQSLKNQARNEPLDQKTVDLYQEGVERGDAFPAVIAYRPGRAANAKLVTIDGNHRLFAHVAAKAPIAVYEIDRTTRGQTVAMMTFSFNTRHGRPTSEEERVSHAKYLVENGSTMEAAASAVNAPLRLVRRALERAKADQRADEVGVDRREWDALPMATKQRLLQISTDEGYSGAVHLAYQATLPYDDIAALVSLLNSSRSGAKQRAIVKTETDRYRDRIQTTAGGVIASGKSRRPMSARGRVSLIMGQLMALPDDAAAIARTYAENERQDAANDIENAAVRLHKIALQLDPRIR